MALTGTSMLLKPFHRSLVTKMTNSFIAYLLGNLTISSSAAFFLYRAYEAGEIAEGSLKGFFLLYGLLALVLQLPLGFLGDRFKSNGRLFAFAGCIFTAAGLLMYQPNSVNMPEIFISLGFALFFAGGATDALTQVNGLTRPALFVASGVLGSALGIKLSRVEFFPSFYLVILLLFCAAMIIVFCRHKREEFAFYITQNRTETEPLLKNPVIIILMTAFVAFARSWAAMSVIHPESESKYAWAIPSAALVAGIIVGGIASDLIDKKYIGSLSLAACALMFFLAPKRYLFYLCGLGFAGMSTPLTLCNIAHSLKKYEGAAVGIFSAAVFGGELVGRLAELDPESKLVRFSSPAVLIASAVILFLATAGVKKQKN